MADALVSGTSARKGVEVRVLFFAQEPGRPRKGAPLGLRNQRPLVLRG